MWQLFRRRIEYVRQWQDKNVLGLQRPPLPVTISDQYLVQQLVPPGRGGSRLPIRLPAGFRRDPQP
jgi:hypothetical protein